MYEGTPDAGGRDRWWSIVEKYRVTIFYTAPTAIRTFMKWGEDLPGGHDLSRCGCSGRSASRSTRRPGCGTAGSSAGPLPDRRHLVADRDRRHDDQPAAGVTATKPGSAMGRCPDLGRRRRRRGHSVGETGGGFLTLDEPWPSMLRGIWGDEQRYRDTYWSRFEGQYFAGDGAKWDDEHVLWLLGRVDDVMNISGHRISRPRSSRRWCRTRRWPRPPSSARGSPRPGQAIVAFVTVKGTTTDSDDAFLQELRDHVAKEIGAIAKPRQIVLSPELPKTRSGKIMRRLLVDIAGGASSAT
jgi:acetyl-CoA synthetase